MWTETKRGRERKKRWVEWSGEQHTYCKKKKQDSQRAQHEYATICMFASTLQQLVHILLSLPFKQGEHSGHNEEWRAQSNPREAELVSIESWPDLKTYDCPQPGFVSVSQSIHWQWACRASDRSLTGFIIFCWKCKYLLSIWVILSKTIKQGCVAD